MNKTTEPQAQMICVGIDWADQEHVYHLVDQNGKSHCGTVKQDAAQIRDLIDLWQQKFPGCRFAVAIEQSKGPLINALLPYDALDIYPVNPAAIASYRKAFAHGGGKNDPTDAQLICQYVLNYRTQMRPLKKNDPLTTELASLGEDRRRFVDQRAALSNELRAILKLYFPTVLQIAAAELYAVFLIRFLLKYPSLQAAQKAGPTKLRKFFFGVGAERKAQERVDLIMNAVPLTNDDVTLRSCVRRVSAIVSLIHSLNVTIERYDREIHDLVKKHADYPIVASLPGAGDATHCRIIAALGDDRSRFQNAEALQACTGIAPLTHQSGKQRTVTSRWACSKFLKQTFHEYAGLSIKQSQWAKAYYDQQRAQGKSAQTARRALAYKWLRIIFRCWQDRVPYNEARYLERLKANGSPLAKLLT